MTERPLGRYCASTSGLPHSSSQPFSIATAVYWPGITLGRRKLPSRSLWSLRNSSTLSLASDGISTIMTSAAGFPSFTANPSTAAEPATTITVTDTVVPGATRTVLLRGFPPTNCPRFCVAVACDFAFSGGDLGSYADPVPHQHFPLVGPSELVTIENFDTWDIPIDLHQRLVSFYDAKRNLPVIGGILADKAVGSHFKVTFPGAVRSWPLDYNVDPIPDRFLDQLPTLVKLPMSAIKYALIFGEMPKKKPRF